MTNSSPRESTVATCMLLMPVPAADASAQELLHRQSWCSSNGPELSNLSSHLKDKEADSDGNGGRQHSNEGDAFTSKRQKPPGRQPTPTHLSSTSSCWVTYPKELPSPGRVFSTWLTIFPESASTDPPRGMPLGSWPIDNWDEPPHTSLWIFFMNGCWILPFLNMIYMIFFFSLDCIN